MLSRQTDQEHYSSFGIFSIRQKAQLPAIRITEQPMLGKQRVRLIVQVINFLSIFAKTEQSNLALVLVLESIGP